MIFEITQHDTEPPIRAILRDADGTVARIFPGDVVTFRMRPTIEGLRSDIDATAVVLDGTAGDVQYEWDPADTAFFGTYEAQFHISTAAGGEKTFPNAEYIDVIIRRAA